MTKERQRIKIAEALGWTDIEIIPAYYGAYPVDTLVGKYKRMKRAIPEYQRDLNACHEMEKAEALKHTQPLGDYDTWLRVVTHRDYDCLKYREGNEWGWPVGCPVGVKTSLLWSASAEHRCEAFLRALNLWEDTP